MKNLFITTFLFLLTSFICQSQEFRLSQSDVSKITQLLSRNIQEGAKITNVRFDKDFIHTFIESGDYGPMWYGDTIVVNKPVYVLKYNYQFVDSNVDRSKGRYSSKDWESDNTIYFTLDKKLIFKCYSCKFGGIPPSFGYANRKIEWDDTWNEIFSIIDKSLKR